MPGVIINVRSRDIRRVRISCRCGKQSIAEIPQQVAAAMNLHVCGCGAGYGIQQISPDPKPHGKWKIERVIESIANETFQDVDPNEKKEWKM